ncbi:MAG: type II toxin-antitoxin system VapC family toxin [Egibacteraceae bacterium]
MIAYFDTSALVPLVVEEPGSPRTARLWDSASRVVSARIVYAEARAAFAQAHRMQRLTTRALRRAVSEFELIYRQLDRVEIDERLVRRAGQLAEQHALRGYEAVHLAAAQRLHDAQTVLVSGDAALCRAARALGMAVSAWD